MVTCQVSCRKHEMVTRQVMTCFLHERFRLDVDSCLWVSIGFEHLVCRSRGRAVVGLGGGGLCVGGGLGRTPRDNRDPFPGHTMADAPISLLAPTSSGAGHYAIEKIGLSTTCFCGFAPDSTAGGSANWSGMGFSA